MMMIQRKSMGCICFILFNLYILALFSQDFIPIAAAAAAAAAYTLTPSQSISDGEILTSQGGTFELGFFNSSNSNNNRYLGIWYKTIPLQTVVWVANRDSPLNDTSGVLKIGSTGDLVVVQVNQSETVIWSSNSSLKTKVDNRIVEFLESGNLLLRDVTNENPESYFWQSFDYPGDTLLPGVKLGWNLTNGFNRKLSTWRNFDDPSHGDYTYEIDITPHIDPGIKNGSNWYYRGGPWNGIRSSGQPELKPNPVFTYQVIQSAEEIYYMYQLINKSVISRLVLSQTGKEAHFQRFTWVATANSWILLMTLPRDRCDDYAICGAYTTCDMMNAPICQCLKGCKPKSPQDWSGTDWSQGCEREIPLNCSQGEGFLKYTGVKLPDTKDSWVNTSMNFEECKVSCLNNCSCMAYSNLYVTNGGSGCIMWFTDLIDIRQLSDSGADLYIRMAASELGSKVISKTKRRVVVIVSTASVVGLVFLGLGSCYILRKRSPKGAGSQREDLELPIYDLATIRRATDDFSENNKLGEGGFGPVYKGKLEGEQEIAVKRLSKDSMQGVAEFKNEVMLIAKLQHRNLVRILGCCIQGEEKMLVYEYMQNGSLDSSIFDEPKGRLLDWHKRFQIILGIARGLLYLHHDSRLRIIHRDLKASNILLDSEMLPKISDFGMARMFRGDQIDARTKRVVGTYGYMSPEYAAYGHFSMKSDVFSFGVLMLEIISGKKNWAFSHRERDLSLLGHAWRLWIEKNSMELVDESMRNSCAVKDVFRCIHVGLLCVQKGREQRPTMSSVLLMLCSETSELSHPQEPGFYVEKSTTSEENSSYSDKDSNIISNDVTMTSLVAR